MTFDEIKQICFNTIDEVDEDEQIDIIVSNAINEAYAILSRKDKRLTRAFLPIIQGIVTLPSNCLDVIKITPILGSEDIVIGNSIMTDKTGILTVLYNYRRDRLVNPTDEPDLHDNLVDAAIAYACYRYWEHRKKIEVSQLFLSNYNQIVAEFSPENIGVPEVVRYYDDSEVVTNA